MISDERLNELLSRYGCNDRDELVYKLERKIRNIKSQDEEDRNMSELYRLERILYEELEEEDRELDLFDIIGSVFKWVK